MRSISSPPEVDADGDILVGREDRQRVAADAERAAHKVHVVARVLHVDELPHERVAVDVPADVEVRDERLVLARLAEPVDAGDGRDDEDVAPLEERTRGRVPHLVDLVVDVGVLGDIRVGPRDVSLGLVVVVVGDEVLDGVVREEVAELRGELRGERAVRGQHQRRALVALDDVGHREGLAGAGGAEHRLHRVAALEALDEGVERLRLIAGRLKVADELEGGAGRRGHLPIVPGRVGLPSARWRGVRT